MTAASEATPLRVSDEPRFRAIVRTHLRFVWRTARRLGVAEADVEDVTQQVMLVLGARLDEIPAGKEAPFLYATAVRLAANARRAVRRRSSALARLEFEPAAHEERQDHRLEQQEARVLLHQFLEQLPQDLRDVFVLFELEELSMKDVAAALDIPIGTVGSRLVRARQLFQQAVSRYKAKTDFLVS